MAKKLKAASTLEATVSGTGDVELSAAAKARIEVVLVRASQDIKFRAALLKNPATALRGTNLTDAEKQLLTEMRQVKLEEVGLDVRRFRAVLRDNGNSHTSLSFAIAATLAPRKSSAGKGAPRKTRKKT